MANNNYKQAVSFGDPEEERQNQEYIKGLNGSDETSDTSEVTTCCQAEISNVSGGIPYNTGMYYCNAFGNMPVLSQEQQSSLLYKKIDYYNEAESKIMVEMVKDDLKRRRQEGMDRRTEMNKYSKYFVYQTTNGVTNLQITRPDGSSEVITEIINVRGLKLKKLRTPDGSENVEVITYDNCPDEIILTGKECCLDGFVTAMKRAGLVVNLSKRLTESVQELIYAFLKLNAEEFTVPAHFGWNETENGWIFNECSDKGFHGGNTTMKPRMRTVLNAEDLRTIQIITSLGLNAPVLRKYGFVLTKLLFLLVQSGGIQEAISLFQYEGTQILDGFASMKKINSMLKKSNHAFLLYPFTGSKKSLDIIDNLCSIAKTGTVEGQPFTATIIVIADTPYYVDDKNRFLFMSVSDRLGQLKIELKDIVPRPEDLSLVMDKIRDIDTRGISDAEMILKAAAMFMYPQLENKGSIDRYLRATENIIQMDSSCRDIEGLSEMFKVQIFKWTEKEAFIDIYELPVLTENEASNMERSMFYTENTKKEDYLYMSESLFKEILGKQLEVVGIDAVKHALKESGILSTDETSTYTVKMRYRCSKAETEATKRMLRFYSNQLVVQRGEMRLVDQCVARKSYLGGNKYE